MSTFSKFLSLIAGADRTVDLSLSGNALGVSDLQLLGSTSGTLDMVASATTTNYSLTWPAAQASGTQVLQNDGTGTLSWATISSSAITALTGDGTASGPGSAVFTLATVNSNVGSFGSSTSIPSFTVNAKGLITAASGNAVVAPAGTLSGTTLNSTVVTSSLTSVGTITSGTWQGSAVAIGFGGTGQTTAAAAFAALSPMTTAGDIIYENATPAPARLPIGSNGQVLTVVSGLPAWAASAISPGSISLTQNHVLVGNASNLAADVAMSGDASIVSSGALTLATVNSNVGTFGDSSDVTVITVNGKGLITAVSTASITAPAGALTGTSLNSSVVSSSLTSLGVQSQALNMGTHQINDVANGTVSTDAVNLGQLQAAISGLYWQGPAQAYADSNVPLTGAASLTIDSYSVQNGDLVILGNQTTASQNGEYTASGIGSAYVLTPNGLPTAAGDAWLILDGTVYGDSAFVANAAVPAATFTQFAGPTAYTFSAPLSLTGRTVSITQSTTSTNGYLSSTDWNTFNNKQAAGNYITALTGDATASGPGSAALTLATVNSNVGSFGSSTSIPSFTVNAKGLITAASGNAVVAPAGTLSGTTLNSTVVSSSLTSVGTISSGTWQGSAVAIAYGGTGQVTAAAAYNALSPMTTTGDIEYEASANTAARLPIGSTGQVLTVVSGLPAWAAPSVSPGAIALTQNHILVGDASNLAADVAMSGDVAIVASGATTIQPGVVTAAKLATVTDGVTTDQSGSGSTIEVLYSPAVKQVLVAGQTFTANTSYAVRWGLTANGETSGRIYAADITTSSFDLFYVIGMVSNATTVSAGGNITVTRLGAFALSSSDTAFASSTDGAPVFLTASGTFSVTAPSSSGQAVVRIGIVKARSATVTSNVIDVSPQTIGVN